LVQNVAQDVPMPGSGVYFALTADDERQLLALTEPRSRAAFVANGVEERWDEAWLHASGEAWFAVHFCLHGSSAFPASGLPPEARTVFGGVPLGVPNLYSIDYKDQQLVRQIGSALGRMRDDAVWARAGLVERKDFTGPRDNGLQVAVVDEIHAIGEFYRRAADAAHAVIFTVDL
jgi:hypothetical protein